MNKFDILIPVGSNDVKFVPRVIKYISLCLENVNNIYIITSAKNICLIKKQIVSRNQSCLFIDEDKLLPNLSLHIVTELLRKYSPNKEQRAGWYFQQFLKFAFAQSQYSQSFYLTWDADTLPLAPISFFEGNNVLYNPKQEYNPNYFTTIKRLFGFGKKNKHSFIAENMMFSKEIVCKMLQDIEKSKLQGNSWFEKIISACDFNNPLPSFSEFETYGTYCSVKYPNLYKPRHLNTFREAGFICGRNISDEKLRIMSFDLDTASFEIGHEPMFPYNLPNLWIKFKKRFSKLVQMSLKEFINRVINNSTKTTEKQKVENTIYRLPKKDNKK